MVVRGLVDKARWERGPWDDEPDKIRWLDTDSGLVCLVMRHPKFGHWCGYVGVPEGFPSFGKSTRDIGLTAHGGVNFSGWRADLEISSDDAKQWWFGFDCGHAFDLTPAVQEPKGKPAHLGRIVEQFRTTLNSMMEAGDDTTPEERDALVASLQESVDYLNRQNRHQWKTYCGVEYAKWECRKLARQLVDKSIGR